MTVVKRLLVCVTNREGGTEILYSKNQDDRDWEFHGELRHKDSLFSTFSQTLAVRCLLDTSHSDSSEMISHCGFDPPFPDGYLSEEDKNINWKRHMHPYVH